MEAPATPSADFAQHYAVQGMTCGACARQVETALVRLPGVRSVQVEFASGSALVEFTDERRPSLQMMQQAIADAGFTLDYARGYGPERDLPVGPVLLGLLAVAGLLSLYLGLITLAQGWTHAYEQFSEDRWFVGTIAAGFGIQIGLFAYLRPVYGRAAAGGVAASTGTSTAGMLACCAHHLSDVLPVIGVSGAAVFLNLYKTPLLWLGIIMNAAGIGYMLWQMRRLRRVDALHLNATPSRANC